MLGWIADAVALSEEEQRFLKVRFGSIKRHVHCLIVVA